MSHHKIQNNLKKHQKTKKKKFKHPNKLTNLFCLLKLELADASQAYLGTFNDFS